MWIGSKDTPLTFVLTSDLAGYLADAVEADVADGERIDIGWTRPVSMTEAAGLLSKHGEADAKDIKIMAVPTPVLKGLGKVTSRFAPLVSDMASMSAWFETGRYVANTSRQAEVFGPPPSPEDAIARFAAGFGH